MRLEYSGKTTASLLAGLLIFAAPGVGMAESLAGKVGDSRFVVNFPPGSTGDCPKAYKDYVAASGHSAYATTFYSRVVDLYIICGARLNAPTQKAAEDLALRSCQAGVKRWKVKVAGGGCGIAASK
ncbi:hypothetical protein LHFGNBLO_005240 [Mesorhizobium sp. AR10]|uniref:hypothetical protein n=1 Tax=Mesorhizobium sp. AR10 TaxID=2865839 RepID=UPI0021606B69|nr:hypothetical protein [Mesorhizobium sp. AR10]UVK41710.1 hypothetical protein LHFGNBLO_005240 [Mesorhizobium sp. AR10]